MHELKPDYASTYKNRGLTYYESGKLAQAVQDLEQYLEMVPDDPDQAAISQAIEQMKAELGK